MLDLFHLLVKVQYQGLIEFDYELFQQVFIFLDNNLLLFSYIGGKFAESDTRAVTKVPACY